MNKNNIRIYKMQQRKFMKCNKSEKMNNVFSIFKILSLDLSFCFLTH